MEGEGGWEGGGLFSIFACSRAHRGMGRLQIQRKPEYLPPVRQWGRNAVGTADAEIKTPLCTKVFFNARDRSECFSLIYMLHLLPVQFRSVQNDMYALGKSPYALTLPLKRFQCSSD